MSLSPLLNIANWFACLPHEQLETDGANPFLIDMARCSSLLGVVAVILGILLMLLLYRSRHNRWSRLFSRMLTTSFFVVWLLGFVVYDVGMYIDHSRWSLLTNVPMAIIHSTEMFLLESDAAAIQSAFHHNWLFMLFFSLAHFLAAIITLMFVIRHFGYNIIAGCRMFLEAYVLGGKRDTFVFWGLNEPTYLLAQSIKEHYRGREGAFRIIIVRTNYKGDAGSVKNGMERLFNFVSLRDNDLERLIELDCLTTGTYADASQLSLQDSLGYSDVLKRMLNLNQLARIIRRKTTGSLHMFLLTDKDDVNIKIVQCLKRDVTVGDATVPVTLYCKARYNSMHRVIEDEQHNARCTVRVVDPSHISVEMLKQDVTLHPVSYVDVEHDATVSSAFNALVVGFGEVGYDSVRFLYEFGSFVKSGSTDDNVQRAPFHCDVVDKDIMTHAGVFAFNSPAIVCREALDGEPSQANTHILLHDVDTGSVAFYKYVEKIIDKLNYVVITLDDDESNMSLAVRILRLAVRYRKDMRHLRILVRVCGDHDGHLKRIAEHYNRLWAAECCSDGGHQHQHTITKTEHLNAPITCFGSLSGVFTWDSVVGDTINREARAFMEKYEESIRNLKGAAGEKTESWDEQQRRLMQLNDDEYPGYSPTLTGITKLRRMQRQNMENCFHKLTKQQLAALALGDDRAALLTSHVLSREVNQTTYLWQESSPDQAVTRVLDVIAQTEHLRWVASHEILGYRDHGDVDYKNEVRMLHGCLKPWQELSTRVKSYDYNIVDVSLGII